MWDRLLTDCHVLTMVPSPGNPLGLINNAAIGIHDGRIVRVGRRTELAGTRAGDVMPLGGAFVTPGLIDCHTHLVFGGTRAGEHARRRAGATYEEIAREGGGIASTVRATEVSGCETLASTGQIASSPASGSRMIPEKNDDAAPFGRPGRTVTVIRRAERPSTKPFRE